MSKPKLYRGYRGGNRNGIRLLTKPQAKPRKIRETRTIIISFRLRQSEIGMLLAKLKKCPIAGVKSVKQFARKLTIDHAMNRTVYIDPMDQRISPDSRSSLMVLPPNCQIENARFRKSLSAFLNTGENWRKLRLFMLQAGWPEETVNRYNGADTEQDRLLIAQEVLKHMPKKKK